jgi:hypothetical protein
VLLVCLSQSRLRVSVPLASPPQLELLGQLLTCCPERRVGADRALLHGVFRTSKGSSGISHMTHDITIITTILDVVSTLVCQPVLRTAPLVTQQLDHLLQLEETARQTTDWGTFPR